MPHSYLTPYCDRPPMYPITFTEKLKIYKKYTNTYFSLYRHILTYEPIRVYRGITLVRMCPPGHSGVLSRSDGLVGSCTALLLISL